MESGNTLVSMSLQLHEYLHDDCHGPLEREREDELCPPNPVNHHKAGMSFLLPGKKFFKENVRFAS